MSDHNFYKPKRLRISGGLLFVYLVLIFGALVMTFPFVWTLFTSFKTPAEVFAKSPFWIPIPPRFLAYAEIITKMPFLTYTFNSIKVATLITTGQLVTCSLAGYAFAKIKFPGRDFIFLLLLTTMMVPLAITIIPNFIIISKLKLIDTSTGLVLPFIGSAYGIFLMRQFFLVFPSELEDSAKLDGCNPLGFFFYILLPNSKPILATFGLITFRWSWNQFLWPLIIIRSDANRTLQLGLSCLGSEHYINWTLLMAASVLTNLPIIILFFFAQKQFIESIKLSGLKG